MRCSYVRWCGGCGMIIDIDTTTRHVWQSKLHSGSIQKQLQTARLKISKERRKYLRVARYKKLLGERRSGHVRNPDLTLHSMSGPQKCPDMQTVQKTWGFPACQSRANMLLILRHFHGSYWLNTALVSYQLLTPTIAKNGSTTRLVNSMQAELCNIRVIRHCWYFYISR